MERAALVMLVVWIAVILITVSIINEKINNLELQITANHLETLTLIANKQKTKVDVLRSIKKTRENLNLKE